MILTLVHCIKEFWLLKQSMHSVLMLIWLTYTREWGQQNHSVNAVQIPGPQHYALWPWQNVNTFGGQCCRQMQIMQFYGAALQPRAMHAIVVW